MGATLASADQYTVYNNGNQPFGTVDVPATPGPQGNPGLNGSNGTNGTDGVNGTNGANGANGTNGTNGKDGVSPKVDNSAKLVVDAAVRLYDGKRVQLQLFDTYALDRQQGHDVLGDGRNMMFGTRIVFKLGSSYEERELAKQSAEISALRAQLSKLVK